MHRPAAIWCFSLRSKWCCSTSLRNDAMFAPMCPQAHIIRRSRHHWRSQHHLPKANIIQKSLVSLMMHRLRRYDVFRFAQNDVAPLRSAMMRCLPQCAVRHTSLGEAVITGVANIICRRQTSFKKRTFVGRQKCVFCCYKRVKRSKIEVKLKKRCLLSCQKLYK